MRDAYRRSTSTIGKLDAGPEPRSVDGCLSSLKKRAKWVHIEPFQQAMTNNIFTSTHRQSGWCVTWALFYSHRLLPANEYTLEDTVYADGLPHSINTKMQHAYRWVSVRKAAWLRYNTAVVTVHYDVNCFISSSWSLTVKKSKLIDPKQLPKHDLLWMFDSGNSHHFVYLM